MTTRNSCRKCGEPLHASDDLCYDCMKDFEDSTLNPSEDE
jgi:NMD protein affecting ribosome stability and mRNA decay